MQPRSHPRPIQGTREGSSPIEAVLLDYGNTVVKFDVPQIEIIRIHVAEVLSKRVGPVTLTQVSETFDRIFAIPYEGDPPDYREFTPVEQMEVLLASLYGPPGSSGKALSSSGRRFPVRLVEELNDYLQDVFVRAIRVPPETPRFLARLREWVAVGIVSNYPCGPSLRRSLRETGLDSLVDPIVVSGEVGYVKPHPRVFEAALDRLRDSRGEPMPPDRVLFVGDRWDADMVGAKRSGMRTCHHVGFTSDLDLERRYEVYRPDHQIRSIEEIEAIVFGPEGMPSEGGPRAEVGSLRSSD